MYLLSINTESSRGHRIKEKTRVNTGFFMLYTKYLLDICTTFVPKNNSKQLYFYPSFNNFPNLI